MWICAPERERSARMSLSAPARNWLYFAEILLKEKTPPLSPVLFWLDSLEGFHAYFFQVCHRVSRMAKHGKKGSKRSMANYLKGIINETLSLGTLAARTLISDIFDDVVSDSTLVASVEAIYSLRNFTASADDGPIQVGLAHSDYSDAQLQAVLDSVDSWSQADLPAKEIANRKMRSVGVFEIPTAAQLNAVLNDGKPIKTKLNWRLESGQGLRLWAYNVGTSNLATTVPVVTCDGHANLFVL